MAKAKNNINNGRKLKTFHVYLNNGQELEIKASRFQVIADDFQIHFYDDAGNVISDTFLSRSEVAAILPE